MNGSVQSSPLLKACFFSNEPLEQLSKEQYSIQDISILSDLGYELTIATSFSQIPFGCDLYFSWWASGSILPLIKARLSKKPIIVVAGGNEAMYYRDSVSRAPSGYLATPWYKKIATRVCLRFAQRVLTVSKFMEADTKSLGARSPITVYNSVNTNIFTISNISRSYVTSIFNLEDSTIKIKRGDIYIKSIPYILKEFPDQKFIIIGSKQNGYQKLKQLVVDLGINKSVDFIGSIDNSHVCNWLQSSRVYVQISDTETFGVAVAEAMSCGTPVVVSRRGALPELVGDCGIFVDHNDPKSVANGIIGLLRLPEKERDKIGLNGRARIVNNFTYEARKERIEEIIKTLDQ